MDWHGQLALRARIVAEIRRAGQARGKLSQISPLRAVRFTIDSPKVKRVGPTIAKSRQTALVERRTRPLVRCTDYRWRELFETADVLSEGAIRQDEEGPAYYGSTSILLSDRSHGGHYEDNERTMLCQLLTVDPHARIRAIRMACLEAQLRARTPIASFFADFAALEVASGIRITVDVEARVATDANNRSYATSRNGRGKR